MTIADQLVVLDAGAIAQVGTPEELYRRPATTFVAGFIGSPSTNLLDGTLRDGVFEGDGVRFAVPGNDGAVTLGVRPEDVLVTPSSKVDATVEVVELIGPRYVLIVRAGAHRLTAVVEAATVAGWERTPAPGDAVTVDVRADRVHLFDAESGRRLP